MASKHKRTAVTADDPGADVKMSDWNDDHAIDDTLSAPATGKLSLMTRSLGRKVLASVDENSYVTELQQSFAHSRVYMWTAPGNGAAMAAIGGTGTFGGQTTRSPTFTNYFTSQRRCGFMTAATLNANNSARGFNPVAFASTTAKMGGFYNVWRVGVQTYHAEARMFVGMGPGNSSYGAQSPGPQADVIWFGFAPGDTNWAIFHNDGTGTATKIDLGTSFPCNTNSVDVMEFTIASLPGSGTFTTVARNLTTGAIDLRSLTTDIPVGILLQPHLNVTTGASAVAVGLDFMQMYLATDN